MFSKMIIQRGKKDIFLHSTNVWHGLTRTGADSDVINL